MKNLLKGLFVAAVCMLSAQSVWAIGNNEIHYTTTDGCKIMLNGDIALGANVISNIYENGQGVITFDQDVIVLEESAFEGNTTLNSIDLPKSVKGMGSAAFAGCESLTEVNLPGVTNISDFAFFGCSSLKHLSIEAASTQFGLSALEGCIVLTDIETKSNKNNELLSLQARR